MRLKTERDMHCTSANLGAKPTLAWEFSGGTWTRLASYPFFMEGDWSKAIEAAGYCSNGGDDWDLITLYEADRQTETTERWKFLVEVAPLNSRVYLILLPDLPDLMGLLPAITAMQQQSRVDELVETATTFFDKTFQAWHGHSLHGSCYECDPVGFQRRHDLRARTESKRRQEAAT